MGIWYSSYMPIVLMKPALDIYVGLNEGVGGLEPG